jgi:hypothetical protein
MQPTTHVIYSGTEAGERIGLKIDVTKLDQAGSGRADQPAALPLDSGITDRAFGVVPDCEFRANSPSGTGRMVWPSFETPSLREGSSG